MFSEAFTFELCVSVNQRARASARLCSDGAVIGKYPPRLAALRKDEDGDVNTAHLHLRGADCRFRRRIFLLVRGGAWSVERGEDASREARRMRNKSLTPHEVYCVYLMLPQQPRTDALFSPTPFDFRNRTQNTHSFHLVFFSNGN